MSVTCCKYVDQVHRAPQGCLEFRDRLARFLPAGPHEMRGTRQPQGEPDRMTSVPCLTCRGQAVRHPVPLTLLTGRGPQPLDSYACLDCQQGFAPLEGWAVTFHRNRIGVYIGGAYRVPTRTVRRRADRALANAITVKPDDRTPPVTILLPDQWLATSYPPGPEPPSTGGKPRGLSPGKPDTPNP